MSHRMSGEAVCDLPSCRWRSAVEVEGGQTEFREKVGRVVDVHRRSAHPWLFASFAEIDGLPLWACSWCGAAVADTDAHGGWHKAEQV
jgi:hypothetical protein